jgi:glycosyltransferase involved in cell wall biosynthesis
MKIKWHGMVGTNHSWSHVSNNLIRQIDKLGHHVSIKSTNGLKHFPEDLKKLLLCGYHDALVKGPADYINERKEMVVVSPHSPLPEVKDNNVPYDLEMAYTVFYQIPRRFRGDAKSTAVIWNFESSILPCGWDLYTRDVDYVLPSSQYAYDIFANGGVSKDKMLIVPHGVDTKVFNKTIEPCKLKTAKKIKFLHMAIPHARKQHDKVIEGFFDTFSSNDDVCLVLKTKFIEPDKTKPFEVDVKKILQEAYKKYKNPPEVEIVTEFFDNPASIINACDVVISMSSAECFLLPMLEALACEKLVISPRHGGQLDFLNDENSLLVDTKEMYAPVSHQYWGYYEKSLVGNPSLKHYKELLVKAYKNFEEESDRVKQPSAKMVEKFSWEKAAQMIVDLPIKTKTKSNKRRVSYIIPYNVVGGGEVWVYEQIKRLDKNLYEPVVILINGTAEEFKIKLLKENVKIEDLSEEGGAKALYALLETEKYDIINFYNSVGVYKILKDVWNGGLRCRIVEIVHSDFMWADSMAKVSKRDPFVSLIIAVSNTVARSLLKKNNKNVFVLPQQVDWSKSEERSKSILEENIREKFIVGFVGRLSHEKNIPIILKCAEKLPDVEFIIVGDGPQKETLKQMSKGSNIHFVGAKSDVEKYYASFDVLILPSIEEGLPLVILEALNCGVPVIASDVGAIREIIIDGISGNLVWNPQSENLFINEIMKLKNNTELWNQYSINAKTIAKAQQNKEKFVNINNIYNLLFGG